MPLKVTLATRSPEPRTLAKEWTCSINAIRLRTILDSRFSPTPELYAFQIMTSDADVIMVNHTTIGTVSAVCNDKRSFSNKVFLRQALENISFGPSTFRNRLLVVSVAVKREKDA